jgi:rhamnosyltransferase
MTFKTEPTTKVAILLSTYNGEKYLRPQIESLLNQRSIEFSIIVRDDNSSDKSESILLSFSHNITILPKLQNRKGSTFSYLNLLQIALKHDPKFTHFAFCDQDDIWLPENLIDKYNSLRMQSGPALSYSAQALLKHKKIIYPRKFIDMSQINDNPFFQNPIRGCTMLLNRALAEEISRLDSNKIIKHDFATYICAKLFGKIVYVNKIGMFYRIHQTNESGQGSFLRRFKILLDRFGDSAITLQTMEILTKCGEKIESSKLSSEFIELTSQRRGILIRANLIFRMGRVRINVFENVSLKTILFFKKAL